MIEQLFGSKTRVKLLKLFMSNPNRSFYVREITRKIDEQINSVRRELSNLLSIGIITSDSSNNKLYYEVSQKFEHYDALVSMFGDTPARRKAASQASKGKSLTKSSAKKSSALRIGKEERELGNVELVVLGGMFTRDKRSPVDVLIVGDVTPSSLDNYIAKLEQVAGSELSYATFTSDEFAYRRQINDRFILTMLGGKLTVKVDKNDVLSETDK